MGRTVAHALARAGCTRLALLDQNESGLAEVRTSILAEQTGRDMHLLTLTCDVSDESSVADAFDVVRREFARLDYAINCAGIGGPLGASDTLAPSDFDKVLAVNLRGVFLCARQELSIMKSQELDADVYPGIPAVRAQRGAIVNISSAAGVATMRSQVAYCTSKAAVLALTRSDAVDYAAERIRVNAVAPGAIETPLTHATEEIQKFVEAHAVDGTPMKRWGKADEVADTCLFLCSNKASFIQGAMLPIDGGYIAL